MVERCELLIVARGGRGRGPAAPARPPSRVWQWTIPTNWLGGGVLAVEDGDDRGDVVAEAFVGDAHYVDVFDVGVGGDDLLDLFGEDLLAPVLITRPSRPSRTSVPSASMVAMSPGTT